MGCTNQYNHLAVMYQKHSLGKGGASLTFALELGGAVLDEELQSSNVCSNLSPEGTPPKTGTDGPNSEIVGDMRSYLVALLCKGASSPSNLGSVAMSLRVLFCVNLFQSSRQSVQLSSGPNLAHVY